MKTALMRKYKVMYKARSRWFCDSFPGLVEPAELCRAEASALGRLQRSSVSKARIYDYDTGELLKEYDKRDLGRLPVVQAMVRRCVEAGRKARILGAMRDYTESRKA